MENNTPPEQQQNNTPPPQEEEEGQKGAMRSFLQRGETRLSTLQRIGGVFLNGAGLLVLLPVFTKDTFATIFKTILSISDNKISFLLLVVLIITLILPLYALYLLFEDIVHFYFTSHHPGFANARFFPRFILSGLALPPDDTISKKKEMVIEKQLTHAMMDFIISPNEKKGNQTVHEIPYTRDYNNYNKRTNYNKDESLVTQEMINAIPSDPNQKYDINKKVDLFHSNLGLAALIDRSLVDEVAKMETSIVRHILHLRRLILRYIKALLILIWTTLILGITASCISGDSITGIPKFSTLPPDEVVILISAAGFLLWAIVLPRVVRAPINWIYDQTDQNKEKVIREPELMHFEEITIMCTITSFFFTSLALVFELKNIFNLGIIDFLCLSSMTVVITILFAVVPIDQRIVLKGRWQRMIACKK